MAIVSTANLKGGVGKTSCTFHVGGELARMGRRVLLVDNDPQASLTAGIFGPEEPNRIDPAGTLAAVHAGDEPLPEAVIRATPFAGLDLAPGSPHAGSFNVPDPHKAPYEAQARLRDFLDPIRDRYDVILIDNPPNLYMASWSAMAASDALLVPVHPEKFGALGTGEVIASASMVRAVINPGLALLGYLVSMYQARRAVHRVYVEQLRAARVPSVFEAMVPMSVDYVDAVVACKPVGYHKPRGLAARAVRAVADELLARLAASAAAEEEAA